MQRLDAIAHTQLSLNAFIMPFDRFAGIAKLGSSADALRGKLRHFMSSEKNNAVLLFIIL
ncbi:hypothetical protein [Paenibacillus sp. KS-LC4]|uniref:hypothetical protein n=1 Tax=Paenibacillus sp. KS-LC4 TaxID=2979727 RepID=UPI0030CC5190